MNDNRGLSVYAFTCKCELHWVGEYVEDFFVKCYRNQGG